MLPTFEAGLRDATRFPRFAATEALGNVRKSPKAAEILIGTLVAEDIAVANRAAVSLGVIAKRNELELNTLRPKILESLLLAFHRHADDSLADHDWGWRVIGNALLDLWE